jgi:hypothetical protein
VKVCIYLKIKILSVQKIKILNIEKNMLIFTEVFNKKDYEK